MCIRDSYCSYSNIQAPDFIVAFKNHEIPKINFNPEQLCAGTSIDFEVSVEGATLYSWDFGDGQSAQSTVNYGKITHQYACLLYTSLSNNPPILTIAVPYSFYSLCAIF